MGKRAAVRPSDFLNFKFEYIRYKCVLCQRVASAPACAFFFLSRIEYVARVAVLIRAQGKKLREKKALKRKTEGEKNLCLLITVAHTILRKRGGMRAFTSGVHRSQRMP